MNKVLDIFKTIILNILATLIITIVSSIWSKLELNLFWLCVFLVIITIIQSFVQLILALWKKFSFRAYNYRGKDIKYDYIILNYKINKIENGKMLDYKLECSRELIIQSNKKNLDRILDKYLWTGKNPASIPETGKNIQSIMPLAKKPGIWNFYEILFYKRIDKKEQINIAYKWPEIKDCKSSSPFVSMPTEVPTKKLTFNIDLGSEYANQKLILEEYRSIDSDIVLSKNEYRMDENGKCTIEIYPKRFRYHIVSWNW